ncbi:MAG: response regulator transcription factor, partial [Chloroflexota bacterium]|nr:response regulator transcription factor [Chloroflexota bacterium]
GEASDGQTALQLVAELQPAVVLVDCCLPDMPGSEVARRIREPGLPMHVLALSAYPERYYLYQMWEAGAAGYLLQTEPLETVVAAVRVVARGKQRWTAEQLARVLYWREVVQGPWESLTARERAVLRLLVAGLNNAASAEALCVTTKTVAYHVANILSKLGVASRLEVVVWVHQHLPDDLVKLPG